MNIETIHFETEDNVILYGLIYKSTKNTKKILISTHGMITNCIKLRDEIIAKEIEEIQIDTLVYNNRGQEIMSYSKKKNGETILGGTAFENIDESNKDVEGAIKFCIEKGYQEIYLMGHSLGSTKTVYTYNKMIENNKNNILEKIKGVILLSLIDIPTVLRVYLNARYPEMLTYAKNMEKEKMENILMPETAFLYPISVKTFLKYARDYQQIDFAKFSDKEYNYKEINNIKAPLMLRWGTVKEMILQKPEDLCKKLKDKIINNKLDIGFIEGGNHNYRGKEEILAKEIKNFLKNIDK